MRCTMRALLILTIFASEAISQEAPITGVPIGGAPVGVSPVAPAHTAQHPTYEAPQFYPLGCETPISQVASFLSCNDNCKDFWSGYAAERAAIASKLCRDCSHGSAYKSCLTCCAGGLGHSAPPGCNPVGCDASPVSGHTNTLAKNHYRSSWSSLHSVPAQPGLDSDVMVARRTRPSQAALAKETTTMSLVVSKNSYTAATQTAGPVVSPYPRNRMEKADSIPTAARQPATRSKGSVHLQATLPPSSGSWAR
jgi:hypothetical protein